MSEQLEPGNVVVSMPRVRKNVKTRGADDQLSMCSWDAKEHVPLYMGTIAFAARGQVSKKRHHVENVLHKGSISEFWWRRVHNPGHANFFQESRKMLETVRENFDVFGCASGTACFQLPLHVCMI